jgi:hypothetical protein
MTILTSSKKTILIMYDLVALGPHNGKKAITRNKKLSFTYTTE